MIRPHQPYAYAMQRREAEARMWADLGRALADEQAQADARAVVTGDPRPADERTPRVPGPSGLAAVLTYGAGAALSIAIWYGVIVGLWAVFG